jgi:hypothetical protein
MSPWGFAAGWLVVAGTTLLTIGTGAQASASLAKYETAREAVSAAVGETAVGQARIVRYVAALPAIKRAFPFGLVPLLVANLTFIFLTPSKLAEIRSQGGEQAADLREYLRSATAWGVLMTGSVLALAATLIQLVLAYQ